jgi:seryl-tRNA synthetase
MVTSSIFKPDFSLLKKEIESEAEISYAPTKLPSYVDDDHAVNQLGRLTSAAVIHDYEETAKAVLSMSEELGKVARRCEDYMRELKEMQAEIAKSADAIRKRGSEMFEEIQTASKATDAVRQAARDMASSISIAHLRVPPMIEMTETGGENETETY